MIYTIGITLVSGLIPLAGLGFGLYFRRLGKKRREETPDGRHLSGEKMERIARRVMITAGIWLLITIVSTILASGLSNRARVLAAVLLVSLQYVTTMVIAVLISRIIAKKDD